MLTPCRVGVVHCLGYPYIAFSRQCQVYPYNSVRPSLLAPLSTTAVLYRIAQSQVSRVCTGWIARMFYPFICGFDRIFPVPKVF